MARPLRIEYPGALYHEVGSMLGSDLESCITDGLLRGLPLDGSVGMKQRNMVSSL
jgi:hypothetical protein